jgi:hypothetical protein
MTRAKRKLKPYHGKGLSVEEEARRDNERRNKYGPKTEGEKADAKRIRVERKGKRGPKPKDIPYDKEELGKMRTRYLAGDTFAAIGSDYGVTAYYIHKWLHTVNLLSEEDTAIHWKELMKRRRERTET